MSDSDSAPQSDKPRVSFVVREDRLEQWDMHVESTADDPGELKEPTYRTRAQLIRTAVDHLLGQSRSGGGETGGGGQQPVGVPESVEERLDDIFQHVYRTQSVLENLDERLTRIEQERRVEGPEFSLEKVVFEMLPDESEVQTPEDAPTAESIASRIGTDTEDVEGALHRLVDTTCNSARVPPFP